MPVAPPDRHIPHKRPASRSRRHSRPKRPSTLPGSFRTEAASGQGYPSKPKPRTRPGGYQGKGKKRRYVLPRYGIAPGDAGHSTTPRQQAVIDRGVREARIRVLRKQAREDAARRRSLGVMGNINAASGALADFIVKGATSVPTTGAGPTFGGLGPNRRSRSGGRIAAAMAPRGVDLSESTVLRGVLQNSIAYPLLAPAAIYEGAAAAVEGVQGNTERAERLAKGVTEGAIGLAARGEWDELANYVAENPLFALAELRGGAALAGRGGGAVARSGVAGERGRRVGSTARSDIEVAPGVTERRHYSPDLIVKGGQVLADRLSGNRPRNPEKKLRQRADFLSDAAVSANRVSRDEEAALAFEARPTRARSRAGRAVERRLPTGKGAGRVLPGRFTRAERDVVPLVMQRVVRSADTLEQDLRTELGRLNREYANREQFRSGEQARANRVQAQAIARVLSDPRALRNAKEIARSADTLTRRANQLEGRAVNLGALDADSATRSKLFPYAQTHMGARYSDAPFQASRAKERTAAADLRKATTERQNARVTYARKLTTAQRRVREARLSYLRKDETYAKLEEQHAKAKAEVQRLRKQVKTDESVRPQLEAASATRRSIGGQLASRAKALHDKPVVRTVKTKVRGKHDLSGRPDLPAAKARWFHGTQGDFDRVTADHGGASNLGAFFTSDPKLAARYASEEVHGTKATPRVYEVRVTPKKTLDIRLGSEDRAALAAVAERLKARADALEEAYYNGTGPAPPSGASGANRILEKFVEGLGSAKTVQEWKTNEARLYDATMRIGKWEGDKGFGGERPLREELRALGFDSIRKGDDGADTLVALTDNILEPVARHDPKRTTRLASETRPTKRQQTAKAHVARAERKMLGLKAERDKGAHRQQQARERFDAARRERVAQQVGARRVFKDENGRTVRSFPTLHDRDGKRLTNEQIVEHMRKAGVPFDGKNPLVAYLPHRPDVRGARAYYQTAFAGRRDLNSQARTGEAQRKGTYDATYNLPTEHLVRLRGVIGRIEQHDNLIRDQGQRRPDGRYFTWDEAEDYAANYRADSHGEAIEGRVELVPIRVAPAKYDQDQMAKLLERQDPTNAPEFDQVMERVFADRLSRPDNTGTRNVVLIPKATADRIKNQMRPAGDEARVGNLAASLFRTTVLPFSFKWLVGNSAEAALRLGAVGAGPNSHRIGKKVLAELRKIDTEQARQAEAALIGGLQFGQKGLTVNRKNAEQFADTPYYGAAKAIELAGRVPPVKLLVGSIKTYTEAVFGFNRWMEQNAQTAALGKWSKREMQEFTGSWAQSNKAMARAVQDVAKGLTETKNVLDAARYLDETLGKYSRFSPGMRRFIQQVAPFLPWYLNAIRFVGYTLPVKHPIKTALLVRVEETIQEDFEAQHANLPPGELKAAIPDGKGGWIDIARYGPFGAWTGPMGGAVEGIVDPFFPQFSTAYKALATGSSFTGRKIKRAPGDERSEAAVRGTLALNSLIEGFVPMVQIGRRIREGGSTPYDTSTLLSPKVKPGTEDSAANRILNPIRPIRLGAAPAAKPQPAPAFQAGPEDVEFERMMRGAESAAPEISDEEFERMLRAAGGG